MINKPTPKKKYVIVTRPKNDSSTFIKQLEALGLSVFSLPSIRIKKNDIQEEIQAQLADITSYDWIVFTSKNGVRFFMDALETLGIDKERLRKTNIAVVGPRTAEAVKAYNLQVLFMPSRFTTTSLAKEIQSINGKKILLPRSSIANPSLKKTLEARGAIVTNVPIYKTIYTQNKNNNSEDLPAFNDIACITFTSPSTVKGFMASITQHEVKKRLISLPVLSIGPVTTKAAKRYGFTTVHTADIHTIDGMIMKIKERIL